MTRTSSLVSSVLETEIFFISAFLFYQGITKDIRLKLGLRQPIKKE